MLNNDVFYHGIIRKTIIAFGNLFSSIYIDRRQGDSVTGPVTQRLQVPIAYAPKEKWIVRLEQDPNLENNTYTTLPRLSFEITGYNYDSSRKVGKMNRVVCNDGTSSSSVFAPVPYNIDISLYVLTKTQEDAMQIIEQILPTFAPEYTVAINALPQMNIIQDVPITLDSISVSDEYDGDFETRRFVTHTLTFTLKLNLFGAVRDNKPIYSADVNIGTDQAVGPTRFYNVTGNAETYTINSDSWTDDL
jgi:hypothetical protein